MPAPFHDAQLTLHFADYVDKVAQAGGVPVQLDRAADPVDLVAHLHGIVLTGGADVDPRRYGSTPGPGQGGYEPDRDRFEAALLDAARDAGIPVLGICRGAQIINVHHGGTLVAHLPSDSGEGHSSYAYPRYERTHRLRVEPGTELARLYGETAVVNSYHHQAVDRLGEGLIATAWATDGVIEAIEHVERAVLAVQWHPEAVPGVEPCFDWIVRKAAEKARGQR